MFGKLPVVLVWSLLFTSFLICGTASATDYYVSTSTGNDITGTGTSGNPWKTIQKAVNTVTGTSGNPANIRVAAGTYAENVNVNAKSYMNFFGGYNPAGWARDIAANVTIIDGGKNNSCILFTNVTSDSVDGFTITNGKPTNGGGIYCSGSSVTITNNIIGGSSARYGGGIYCTNSTVTIANNDIVANALTGGSPEGGGIYCTSSTVTIRNNDITDSTGSGAGGAIRCTTNSTFTIENNFLTGNSAKNGGCVYCDANSTGTIQNNLVIGNAATQSGGGILCESGASPTIRNNTIASNSAGAGGGGVRCFGSSPAIRNNLFYSNSGYDVYEQNVNSDPSSADYNEFSGSTPGMWYDEGNTSLTTIAAVNALAEADFNISVAPVFRPSLTGTSTAIAANNATFQSTLTDATAAFTPGSLAGRLLNPNTAQYRQFKIISNTATTITVWGKITTVAVVGNPYMVFDYHLSSESTLVNAGTNIGVTTDIDGESRPFATVYDVGADEYCGPIITAIADASVPDGTSYTGPTPSLVQGTLPVTWSLVAGPSGMTINASTGVVSWPVATIAGSPHTITIRATNSAGSDDETWFLTVTPVVPVVAAIADGSTPDGSPYIGPTPTLTQGTLPVTWSLITGPGGMTIDSGTGVVSWPTATITGSPHTVTIRATNVAGSDDETWLLTVTPVAPVVAAIADDSTPDGGAYTGPTPTLTQGTVPVTWTLVAGPSGMTINSSTGVVSWPSATVTGSPHTVTIRATNAAGNDDETWLLTVTPVAPVITDVPDNSTPDGSSYTGPTPTLTQGTLPVSWSLVTGPSGMTINAGTGVVSWPTATVTGSPHAVTIRATNVAGSDDETWLLTVTPVAPVVADVPDSFVSDSSAYTGPTPALTQGTLPVTWSLVAGPSGMTINAGTGVVSWPAATLTGSPHTVTIRATNSAGSDDETWLLTVNPVAPVIADVADHSIVEGSPYTGPTPTLTQGSLPVTWFVVAGPGSMTIDSSTGVVSWPDPTVVGSPYTVTIVAGNAAGSDSESWLLTITAAPVAPIIADIVDHSTPDGSPYTGPMPTLTQGTTPVTWSLVAGPGGMTVDSSTGVVSWPTPTLAGSPHTVTIRATNALGSDDETWLLTVAAVPPIITDIADHSTPDGSPYTGPTPTLTQGTTPVTWSLVTGPSGMTINSSTGVVSWPNPTVTGSPHTVTITALNVGGADNETWALTVTPVAPVIAAIADGVTPYAIAYTGPTPTLTQGTTPVTWSLDTGPSGMTINSSTGVVSWPSPTMTGSPHTVTIMAVNAGGADTETWLLDVVQVAPTVADIADHSTPDGSPYTGPTPTITQGTAPITWSLVTGPSGMTIDSSTGVVSWPSPTVTGSPHSVIIRATNAVGSDDEPWQLTVTPVAPVIAAIADGSTPDGSSYTGPTPTLTQGTLPVTWSLVTGPSGMTINSSTGVVSWPNPTVTGSPHTVTINVLNAGGADNETWQLTVTPIAPVVADIVGHSVLDRTAYTSPTPTLTQGTLPVTWSLVTGPSGMTINAGTGVVSWPTSTVTGSPHTVTIRATNVAASDDETWLLTVTPVAPVIAAIADHSTVGGNSYTGPSPTLNQCTLPVTWSLVTGPSGMTINSSTGVVSWPTATVTGSPHTVGIRASNVTGTDDETWLLTVTPVAPVIAGIADHSITDSGPYTGPTPTLTQGTVPLTWSLVSGPSGMTINSNTGVVSWPNPTASGNPHMVTIRVTNAGGSDDERWDLTVTHIGPVAPVIASIADHGTRHGTPYIGSAPSLIQGTLPVIWSLEGGPSGMTINPATGVVSWPEPNAGGGPYTITIMATNSVGSDKEAWLLDVYYDYNVTPSVNAPTASPAGLLILIALLLTMAVLASRRVRG